MSNQIARRMHIAEIERLDRDGRLGFGIVSGVMRAHRIGTPADRFSGGLAVRLDDGDWYLARGTIARSAEDDRLVWDDGSVMVPPP